jgi:hypothetical protein
MSILMSPGVQHLNQSEIILTSLKHIFDRDELTRIVMELLKRCDTTTSKNFRSGLRKWRDVDRWTQLLISLDCSQLVLRAGVAIGSTTALVLEALSILDPAAASEIPTGVKVSPLPIQHLLHEFSPR